jgi:hypothetical protein
MPHRELLAEELLVGIQSLVALRPQVVVVVDVGTVALVALLEAMAVPAAAAVQPMLLEEQVQAVKEIMEEQHQQHHPVVVVVLVL